jgi:hypothetical protein
MTNTRRDNRETVLTQASQAVLSDRNAHYGDPEDNFTHIANLWNSYAKEDLFTATDVAAMMILVKVARSTTSPEVTDHWVDIAGYAACGNGTAQMEAPAPAPAPHTPDPEPVSIPPRPVAFEGKTGEMRVAYPEPGMNRIMFDGGGKIDLTSEQTSRAYEEKTLEDLH